MDDKGPCAPVVLMLAVAGATLLAGRVAFPVVYSVVVSDVRLRGLTWRSGCAHLHNSWICCVHWKTLNFFWRFE